MYAVSGENMLDYKKIKFVSLISGPYARLGLPAVAGELL